MSYLIKLGAQAVTNDMMQNCSDDERQKALAWHAGFYAGLYEVEMLSTDELKDLTNDLK